MGPGLGSVAVLTPAAIGSTPVVVEQAASKRFGITAWLASGWLILVISTAVLAPPAGDSRPVRSLWSSW